MEDIITQDYITEVKGFVCRCCDIVFATAELAENHVRNCLRVWNMRGKRNGKSGKLTSDELWSRACAGLNASKEELGLV